MNNLSNKEATALISKAIAFLKTKKITQQEIESRLNYTSLSKAKNNDRYPQSVIERKTRQELLKELLDEFSLFYNEAYDRIEIVSEEKVNTSLSDISCYIMHYYAFSRNIVDRALVQIVNKRKVIIDYHLGDEHWEGTFNVVENYTFIEAQKLGYTTPVKKLICLFSGTMKYGRPILLGTYSTVKRDGYPAAGRIVFQKMENSELARAALNENSDDRIIAYLKNDVIISKTITPNSLDELLPIKISLLSTISGDYTLIYPDNNQKLIQTRLTIKSNFQVEMLINKTILKGKLFIENINTVQCKFNVTTELNNDDFSLLTLIINIRKKSDKGIYSATATSSVIHGRVSSFGCYLIKSRDLKKINIHRLPVKLILCEPLE